MLASNVADIAVAAGIEWLNKNAPSDWRSRIDLHTLDIDSADFCVLGQVFEERAKRADVLTGYEYAVQEFFDCEFDDDVTGPLGFSSYGSVYGSAMTAAWVRALTA
jgi:hypothetical protein